MEIKVSIFANLKKTIPEKVQSLTWNKFCDYYVSGEWREVAKRNDYEYNRKGLLPLYGLYQLQPGKGRKDSQVQEIYALSLDFDGGSAIEDVESVFGDWLCAIHTTWSHTPEKTRCRLVMPLSRPVKVREYGLLIRWAMEHAEQHGLSPDPACKDASRSWFIPCTEDEESYQYIYHEDGEADVIDADALLEGTIKLDQPEEIEEDVIVRHAAGEVGIKDWGNRARVGDKLKIACPDFEGSSIGSAFLRRAKHGVWMVCMSQNHGHAKTPHKRFVSFVSEKTSEHEEGQPEEGVLVRLDMKVVKDDMKPHNTASNLEYILEHDSRLRGRIWLNTFSNEVYLDNKPWVDEDDTRLSIWLTRVYRAVWNTRIVRETVGHFSRKHKRNPLVEWLESVQWDGVNRLNDWLTEGFGVPDTHLSRVIARRWAIQAISRAMNPGGQADCTLVLVGKQGAGKSTGLRALAGKWFSDTPLDFGKDSYLQISRAWIYEIAELDSFRGKAHSQIKAFLTAQVDNYRVPYKSRAEEVPRHVVFCASTNESAFLSDATGARRFWVVKVSHVDREWIAENSRQIWAEAVHAYRAGEQWWLKPSEESLLFDSQVQYRVADSWDTLIQDYFDTNPHVHIHSMEEIMIRGLELRKDQLDLKHQKRVAECLKRLGYVKSRIRDGSGKRPVVWRLSEEEGQNESQVG
jgi:predicted P-loop ATPase